MCKELKPCRFCGGRAMMDGITFVYIKCIKCGLETIIYREQDEAINAWNRRTNDERTERPSVLRRKS